MTRAYRFRTRRTLGLVYEFGRPMMHGTAFFFWAPACAFGDCAACNEGA